MIELYKNANKWEMVKQLSKAMSKKFKYEKSSWKFYLTCEMDRKNASGIKDNKLKDIL